MIEIKLNSKGEIKYPSADTFIFNPKNGEFGYTKEYKLVEEENGVKHLVRKDSVDQSLTDINLLENFQLADNISNKKYLITQISEHVEDYTDHFKSEDISINNKTHILNRLVGMYLRKLRFIPTTDLIKLRDNIKHVEGEKMLTEARVNKIFNSTGINFIQLFEFLRNMSQDEFDELIGRKTK